MRSYGPGIESRVNRAQRGSVDLCNVLSFGLRAVRTSLAAKLSNNSKEELLCKN
jgi:hypothetical protein